MQDGNILNWILVGNHNVVFSVKCHLIFSKMSNFLSHLDS